MSRSTVYVVRDPDNVFPRKRITCAVHMPVELVKAIGMSMMLDLQGNEHKVLKAIWDRLRVYPLWQVHVYLTGRWKDAGLEFETRTDALNYTCNECDYPWMVVTPEGVADAIGDNRGQYKP